MKRILKLHEVKVVTGLSRSSIYDFINRDLFPKQVKLSANSVGWLSTEVEQWVSKKADMREERV